MSETNPLSNYDDAIRARVSNRDEALAKLGVRIRPLRDDMYRRGIGTLPMTARAYNVLLKWGVVDLDQLYHMRRELLRLPGLGARTFDEIKHIVREEYSFDKEWPEPWNPRFE